MSTNPFAQAPGNAGAPQFTESAAPGQLRLPSRLPDDASKPIPFGRLLTVELRKLLDTRAGRWLLVAIAALIIVASTAVFFTDTDMPPVYRYFVRAAVIPLDVLLPVLGILAVTTEWSQRTGLVTFTLEPRRVRVGLAKWFAAMIPSAFAVLVAFGFSSGATVLADTVRGHSADRKSVV